MARMPRSALAGSSLAVAPGLIGALLVHESPRGRVAVRLTEVEAYGGEREDPGSHAFRGRTRRTQVMFGAPGHLYVYFTYGMHWCANVVCGLDGEAGAVLLRAGKVVEGIELARHRRPKARRDIDLARGPARLASALDLHGEHDGVDLCADDVRVWLEWPASSQLAHRPAGVLRTGPRVGVSGPGGDAGAFPWRFWLHGDPTVSTYRPASRRLRTPETISSPDVGR